VVHSKSGALKHNQTCPSHRHITRSVTGCNIIPTNRTELFVT